MIHLTGTLTCPTSDDLKIVETYLPEHIALSRAEPGCLSFTVIQTSNPMVWHLKETFTDHATFEAHQARSLASNWWIQSQNLVRDFQITEE